MYVKINYIAYIMRIDAYFFFCSLVFYPTIKPTTAIVKCPENIYIYIYIYIYLFIYIYIFI